jgi:hypothetical protein
VVDAGYCGTNLRVSGSVECAQGFFRIDVIRLTGQ